MKIETYKYPESSFFSVEKDMGIITDLFLKNNNLKKLLHYTTPNCLTKPNLTEDESIALIGKNIKMVPKLYVDGSVLNYIIISFDNFTQTENPEFRDNVVEFDVICHFAQWQLQDFQLRPYRIAAEIDTMLQNKKLTNIGKLEFLGASQMIINDEYAGLCLMYQAIHGGEDKKNAPTPIGEEQYVENFNEMFNND